MISVVVSIICYGVILGNATYSGTEFGHVYSGAATKKRNLFSFSFSLPQLMEVPYKWKIFGLIYKKKSRNNRNVISNNIYEVNAFQKGDSS